MTASLSQHDARPGFGEALANDPVSIAMWRGSAASAAPVCRSISIGPARRCRCAARIRPRCPGVRAAVHAGLFVVSVDLGRIRK
jgi:hypothetical protein